MQLKKIYRIVKLLYQSIFELLIGASLLVYALFNESNRYGILIISAFFLINYFRRKYDSKQVGEIDYKENALERKWHDKVDNQKSEQISENENFDNWEDERRIEIEFNELINKSKIALENNSLGNFYSQFPEKFDLQKDFFKKLKKEDFELYKKIKRARLINRLLFKLIACALFIIFTFLWSVYIAPIFGKGGIVSLLLFILILPPIKKIWNKQ